MELLIEYTGLVHHVVCIYSLAFAGTHCESAPTHGGMARLSWMASYIWR